MFDTHKLTERGFEEMQKYKKAMADATREAVALMSVGFTTAKDEERIQLFLNHMETAIFYGAKAIAARPHNHSEFTTY